MKKTSAIRRILGGILSLGILFTQSIFAQTNTLQFTGVNATPENAVQLHWTSTNHELYQIQYADSLIDTNTGSTTWNTLYDQYPSHGTNTFIGDFGNYDITPAIPHPKYMPTRFYRIVDEGADTDTTDNPSIMITAPTNSNGLSDQITVSVVATCSNLPVITTKLYVDGQQMNPSDDGTNYVINTCEWPNGPHVFFAVATARSGFSGQTGNFPIYTSHGVSSYLPVTFSNLVSRIAFSQSFFEPSLGQTQEVTASFAVNCNWTLQIQDVNTNTIRNASGSGTSMTFDWDGTGDGGTNIPDGVYYYLITATTNGMAPMSMLSSPAPVSTEKQLWVLEPDGFVPLAIFPKGIDTNGFTIIQATESQVEALTEAATPEIAVSESSFTPSFTPASLPSSQPSTAPTRPPTAPIKNAVNTYGIAYFSWASPQTVAIPNNNALGVCHLDGGSGSSIGPFGPIPEGANFELNFLRTMSHAGWKVQYDRVDSNLHAQDMRRDDQGYGGGNLFTNATIGLFMDHGDYGTDPDYSAGSSMSKQAYFRCSSDSGDNGWLRMCQIGFGGDLKWMGILACNSLNTFSSMKSAGAIPLKTTHLVCGAATICGVGEDIGAYWANYMTRSFFRKSVADAWFQAGRDQYYGATNLPTVIFRVAGYPECMGDTVINDTAPTSPSSAPGNLIKTDSQVFP